LIDLKSSYEGLNVIIQTFIDNVSGGYDVDDVDGVPCKPRLLSLIFL